MQRRAPCYQAEKKAWDNMPCSGHILVVWYHELQLLQSENSLWVSVFNPILGEQLYIILQSRFLHGLPELPKRTHSWFLASISEEPLKSDPYTFLRYKVLFRIMFKEPAPAWGRGEKIGWGSQSQIPQSHQFASNMCSRNSVNFGTIFDAL